MARKKRATKSTVKHEACSKSKVSHMEKMRLAKKALVEKPEIGESCEAEMEHVYEGVEHDLHAEVEEIIAQPASASASKLNCYRQSFPVVDEEDQLVFRHRNWCLMEIGQLNQLLSDLKCPTCDASVEVTLGDKSGLSRKMKLRCTTDGCNYSAETHTSPRLYNGTRVCQAFDVNHRSVLYSVHTGGGFAALDKFCAIFGMPNMSENAYQRLHKTVCTASVQTCELTLANCRSIVRDNNQEMNPGYVHDENTPEPEDCWDIDDGVPWADVAFDGTWQRRGYVSHYGVGLVVEMLTGYVLDFHVMSTYCLACKIKEKEGLPQDEWDAWMEGHRENCQQNHHASAKAMERDAALKLWTESVERTGLRYRTMLSDGDSTAFRAVEESAPYGERRKVTKLECVNHVHKRMGTALRKQAQENRLGGRGQGRLTAEKCRRLQDYYRGAILSNVDKTEDNMRNAIWGTWFHCTSTDEAPRHNRCPAGRRSWCFYQRALASGEQPGPHANNMRTVLSLEVARQLVPLYRRMSSSQLLQRVMHGQTQNANESLHSVLWSILPKTKFFGKQRVDAAVALAVGKFNQGNHHLTEVMNMLAIDVREPTLSIVQHQDDERIKKANAATQATFLARRRRQHLHQNVVQERLEAAEGPTYGPGIMGDQ